MMTDTEILNHLEKMVQDEIGWNDIMLCEYPLTASNTCAIIPVRPGNDARRKRE